MAAGFWETDMTRKLLLSLVSSILSLCIQPVLAQAPGGGMRTPSTVPGQTAPGQTPGVKDPTHRNSNEPTAKIKDKKVAKDAALGGMTEVELCKLAAQKGSSDDIKQFGQKIVDDHTKANDQPKE